MKWRSIIILLLLWNRFCPVYKSLPAMSAVMGICDRRLKNNVDLRFAFCFPDVYEVGMSHLGSRIRTAQRSEEPVVLACFCTLIDMEDNAPCSPLYGGDHAVVLISSALRCNTSCRLPILNMLYRVWPRIVRVLKFGGDRGACATTRNRLPFIDLFYDR